ncbi:zinc finger C3HC-type protein 1 [Lepisosteus oculatus]|uniref:Zinc finger, C3HC-type containing 1 n=1 Tax=Lepisosteus oculatus TaxID=7918 RepID=W5NG97_LEPOC|nr:PREDICTED: nuclear-interacting partner of ALK [Lepisosteus oculatus]XP_015208065.1 PREDICTED: nuclear-interacting partner of ALK [Lepisosteus oculatus]
MAALSGGGDGAESSSGKLKSPQVTPQKVRELLNDGIALEDNRLDSEEQVVEPEAPNGITHLPCEATSKEGFFSRVETYTSLKWAGKPHDLSPLRCARYGWTNVECDMLKCPSCQAFLCASLQPTQDLQKYKERISELKKSLQMHHEKFCFWPDFPSPDRFWTLPISEPAVLFRAFLDRFKSACLLELQLPSMKPDDLKNMSLTEDAVGDLLQLIEDEVKKEGGSPLKMSTDPLPVQVAACIVALCGWAASPALDSLHLPVLACSYCMRKVGLWGFQQIEGVACEGDSSLSMTSTPVSSHDGRGDRLTPTSTSPCRMVLRSQDATRSHVSEHTDSSPSPLVFRTRSRDSPSPSEDSPSPLARGKRPVTRSRGQGEAGLVGGEVPSSPQRRAKRSRLSSASSTDTTTSRSVFNPVAQHRDWCPWVSVAEVETGRDPESSDEPPSKPQSPDIPQPGWKAALDTFLAMKKSANPQETCTSQGLHDKSKRVFKIFRQWQVSSSQ